MMANYKTNEIQTIEYVRAVFFVLDTLFATFTGKCLPATKLTPSGAHKWSDKMYVKRVARPNAQCCDASKSSWYLVVVGRKMQIRTSVGCVPDVCAVRSTH